MSKLPQRSWLKGGVLYPKDAVQQIDEKKVLAVKKHWNDLAKQKTAEAAASAQARCEEYEQWRLESSARVQDRLSREELGEELSSSSSDESETVPTFFMLRREGHRIIEGPVYY